MRERGFTLIELLAVIVVLAIIAFIAVPMVLNTIEESKQGAAKTSATSYIEAIETKVTAAKIAGTQYEDKEDYVYDEIEVDIKGAKPTGGTYSLKDGIVTSGVFCFNGYEVSYTDNKTEIQRKCTGEELKLSGSVKLSESNGTYTYPTEGTFEVIENISGGTLSCTSSDEEVATCSISGTTVTVTPGTKEGRSTLTIKSEGTSKYTEAKAAYVVITEKGLLSVTATGYSGTYDGNAHSITVTSSGATIKYGTEEGIYDLDASSTYTDAGTYTVYYQVTKEGYKTVTRSKDVVINKAPGQATLSETSGTVDVSGTKTFTVSGATGTLSCTSSDTNVATCSVSETTVTVNGVSDGTTTITINVSESTNYTATSKTYKATVETSTLSDIVALGDSVSMAPTSTSYTIPASLTGYDSDQTINPSELNVWRVIAINEDGTIDMVSEYASSTLVYFKGEIGYKNFVGALNTIAKQYENSQYTVGSRHIGYNGQTETITDTSKITSTTVPWSCTTGGSCNPVESQGGGDIMYTNDTNLVTTALGTLVAKNPSGTAVKYCLASRYYNYVSSSGWSYRGRGVNVYGNVTSDTLRGYNSGFRAMSYSEAVRPIVTLKSGLQAVGSGTSNDPWVLE